MKIRELIIQNCDNTENKGNGLIIHTGNVSEPVETPELFSYLDFLSEEPSRRIWNSDDYRMILTEIDGKITVYEHVRLANYRIQLLDLQEEYGEKQESDLNELADVFAFVSYEHRNNTRKSGVPYISHPMDVASILIKEDAPSELIFAGLLHDIVEDTDVDLVTIRRRYGPAVGDYVEAVTEPAELRQAAEGDKAQTWKERKQYTIKRIGRASSEIRLLACADKLANIRDLISDIKQDGDDFWSKFNAPKDEQEWYYRSMLEAFTTGPQNIADTRAYRDYKDCVDELF
ncbi:HD domain-containing protein [Methanococcoides vulcani]|uniref:HD domain-containing protein n=1 Tax=Methanococcoides vulcani TaxID=1353158 RepID=A0A1H9YM68_9EURY|nr:HD domain-containing protein [Methanococcoides vulcani]SES70172.1 HD domain-containing protein [Methanococcoides vulcani]